MTDTITVKEYDDLAEKAKEYEQRIKEYFTLADRLHLQQAKDAYVDLTDRDKLVLDICEFLLDNVEYRKIY